LSSSAVGLGTVEIPLLVEGDNKPGLGYRVAQTIAAGGINIAFFAAQVIGRKFAAVISFETMQRTPCPRSRWLERKVFGLRDRLALYTVHPIPSVFAVLACS
jgi:hypothetical protein